ncbi:hypothetical protein R3I94_021045 [Phoxinus phoxinus]|uniref:Uncharacterized protein n=1 Tax=Phoxinus phoxinus TaxID=58324 RepID=A0AAN9CAL9_9TELE
MDTCSSMRKVEQQWCEEKAKLSEEVPVSKLVLAIATAEHLFARPVSEGFSVKLLLDSETRVLTITPWNLSM